MASVSSKVPNSLYKAAVSAVVENYICVRKELRTLPENVQFDIYYKLYEEDRLCQLGVEFSDLDVFAQMLKVRSKRLLLLHSFQSLMDHGTKVAKELTASYSRRCTQALASLSASSRAFHERLIDLGLRLGGFLSDAGWFSESEKVLLSCQDLCQAGEGPKYWRRSLECSHKLLHVQTAFCHFDEADETHNYALNILKCLQDAGEEANLAGLYAEFSVLYFIRSQYDEAYRWSVMALKEVANSSCQVSPCRCQHHHLPTRVTVDVLRQAAKACVVKREFARAELLIKEAVYVAREVFGSDHPKYSDSLLDYGFYLLNFDSIAHSVHVYKTALDIRLSVFGKWNIHVASAHEDLAYALYVHEYSSGRFVEARDHAERAINIMKELLPREHLLLASSQRVKALILEEIAIDSMEKELLDAAEKLHLSALKLAKLAFGEMNVQTAKHYGNLGRLYQSMKKFQEAETMHLKAIDIKEQLLGPEDYEVALSVGHLASLYNYHMLQYRKAEELYYRSIAIGQKLFGQSYSGLEYDYRGLLHVYTELGEVEKVAQYTFVLNHWKMLRDLNARREVPPLDPTEQPRPLAEVVARFFEVPVEQGASSSPKTETSAAVVKSGAEEK
ncbi:amyloid protein-binding protein 2 isoform X2 [Ischnura elegans]|uniref:amyloid protein-binding protein 2 isoform X2 n=1 Tax=Ischnura elegans TaxID=197161 RepID=UPI001ED888A2|nr:amyloid protein-binding protein 2 isoform X2 [Ischnura elegans]